MRLTPDAVADEHRRLSERAPVVVPLINAIREDLGPIFEVDLPDVTEAQYHEGVDEVFADGDRAVNVAAMAMVLRDLDVEGDYPGFVVDEVLGRELAGWIAGGQPLALLGEATFHYADVAHDPDPDGDAAAGVDDLDAALAAGFQTRLPGWQWRERPSPFSNR